MKTRCLFTNGIAIFSAALMAHATAFGAVTVLTVPWVPATPTTPHTTYPVNSTTEANIILGATVPSAVGSADSFTYQWNFGDGTMSAVNPVTNPYDISAPHQYPASAATGTQWTATVTVKDTTANQSGTAKYYVIQESNTVTITATCPYDCAVNLVVGARANVAIDWGLWYMHQTMWRGNTTVNSKTVNWGGWDQQGESCPTVNGNAWDCSGYGVIDAENVQAFEVNGHLQNGPATDPYTDDVARGLARMFIFLATQAAAPDTYTYNPATANYTCKDGSVPTTGDPLCSSHGGQYFYNPGATSCTTPNCVITFDANNNKIQTYSNDGSGEYSYTTSPFMEAMIAAGTPTATAPTGPANVLGQTFQNLVQDMADFYNYSQYGSDYDVSQGDTRGANQDQGGAWLYGPQQGDDNSTSQWAAIGLISADRGFGIPVPAIVTDTNNVWITNSQDVGDPKPTGSDSFASGDNFGSYGYRGSWQYSQEWGPFAMTPSGMVQMALDGVGRTTNTVFGDPTTAFDQRWNNSETFYADNFCNNPYAYGAGGGYTDAYYAPRAYMYGLFSFTKSMLLHDPGFSLSPIQYMRTQTPNVFTNASEPANSLDWYAALSSANGGTDACDGVAQTLVTFQTSPVAGVFDGHWYGNTADVGYDLQSNFETSWALIMLHGTGFIACVNNLSGQGSSSGSAPARVDLSWSNQANSTSYNVLRGTTSGGPYTLIGTTKVTAYTDTSGLKNGSTYYYVVQPVNGSTEVCQSNQATVTVPAIGGRH
jgi:hypothetical protein